MSFMTLKRVMINVFYDTEESNDECPLSHWREQWLFKWHFITLYHIWRAMTMVFIKSRIWLAFLHHLEKNWLTSSITLKRTIFNDFCQIEEQQITSHSGLNTSFMLLCVYVCVWVCTRVNVFFYICCICGWVCMPSCNFVYMNGFLPIVCF